MKTATLALAMCLCATAQAQTTTCQPRDNRVGIFANVSASGIASRATPVTACSVVSALESVDSNTVFLAETSTGDAEMRIFYVNEPQYPNASFAYTAKPFPERIVDNWQASMSKADASIMTSLLRSPARPTDAAAVLTSDPMAYSVIFAGTFWSVSVYQYRFAVCASGYPKEGQAPTSVSITNLGPSKNGQCYAKSESFFEK